MKIYTFYVTNNNNLNLKFRNFLHIFYRFVEIAPCESTTLGPSHRVLCETRYIRSEAYTYSVDKHAVLHFSQQSNRAKVLAHKFSKCENEEREKIRCERAQELKMAEDALWKSRKKKTKKRNNLCERINLHESSYIFRAVWMCTIRNAKSWHRAIGAYTLCERRSSFYCVSRWFIRWLDGARAIKCCCLSLVYSSVCACEMCVCVYVRSRGVGWAGRPSSHIETHLFCFYLNT